MQRVGGGEDADNLFALDDEGHMAWRYTGDLQWTAINQLDAANRQTRVKDAV